MNAVAEPLIRFYPTRHGMIAHFASDRHIGLSLDRYGEWAEAELVELLPRIPEGGVVIDVGANIGTHAIAFARKAGPSGRVYAYEAQPEIAMLLSASAVFNDLADSIVVINALAGEAKGHADYFLDAGKASGNWGAESFVERREEDAGARVTLSVAPLDSLRLDRCDLIKIDVEGMERDVLAGARDTLSRLRPTIFFEQRTQENLGAIRAMLTPLGYRLYWHVSNPFNPDNIMGCTDNVFEGHVEVNVLALPPGAALSAQDLKEIVTDAFDPDLPSFEEGLPGIALPRSPVPADRPAGVFGEIAGAFLDRALSERRRFEQLAAAYKAERDKAVRLEKATADGAAIREKVLRNQVKAAEDVNASLIAKDRAEVTEARAALMAEKATSRRLVEDLRVVGASLRRSAEEIADERARAADVRGAAATDVARARRAEAMLAAARPSRAPTYPVSLPRNLPGHSRAGMREIALVARSRFFDAGWYARQVMQRFGRRPRGVVNLVRHYLERGWRRGLEPHPMFSTRYYLAREKDVARSGVCPLVHYLRSGMKEGRDPHPLFLTRWYCDEYRDVEAGDAALHFLARGAVEGRDPHPLFSSAFYANLYPDAAAFPGGAFLHYLRHGAVEGRRPHLLFDPRWYRGAYGASPAWHDNPLADLVMSARGAERDPNPLFRSAWYRAQYRDLQGSDLSSAAHYAVSGEREGRKPNAIFDPRFYREKAAVPSRETALAHYLEHGAAAGIAPHPLFDPAHIARESDIAPERMLDAYLSGEETFDPHPLFSDAHYRAADAAALSAPCPLADYLQRPIRAKPRVCGAFDPVHYLEAHPEVARDGHDPLSHYVVWGEADGWSPNLWFDPRRAASKGKPPPPGGGALSAWLAAPPAARDDPHAVFNCAWYLTERPEAALLPGGALEHVLTSAYPADPHPLFDGRWYRDAYRDSIAPDADPAREYFLCGWREGRRPNRYFEPDFYRRAAGIDDDVEPLGHFVRVGAEQGLSFNPLLDPAWYASVTPDAATFPGGPLAHFVRRGDADGRSPTPLFDPAFYLGLHADVLARGHAPFRHYYEAGASERRRPNALFDPQWYVDSYCAGKKCADALAHYVAHGAAEGALPFKGAAIIAPAVLPAIRSRQAHASAPAPEAAPASATWIVSVCSSSTDLNRASMLRSLLPESRLCAIVDEPRLYGEAMGMKVFDAVEVIAPTIIPYPVLFTIDRGTAAQAALLSVCSRLVWRLDCKRVIAMRPSGLADEANRTEIMAQVNAQLRTAHAHYAPASEAQYFAARSSVKGAAVLDAKLKATLSTMAADAPDPDWHFGVFDDGEPILPGYRNYYRTQPHIRSRFRDPFAVDSEGGLSAHVRYYSRTGAHGVTVAISSSPTPLQIMLGV